MSVRSVGRKVCYPIYALLVVKILREELQKGDCQFSYLLLSVGAFIRDTVNMSVRKSDNESFLLLESLLPFLITSLESL
jgi:hypothetical protein